LEDKNAANLRAKFSASKSSGSLQKLYMKTYIVICIPTRNRVEALAEAILSCERINKVFAISRYHKEFKLRVLVASASDLEDSILERALIKRVGTDLEMAYLYNGPCLMHDNWNEAVAYCVRSISSFIFFVLADRRLITSNIFQAASILKNSGQGTVAVDHGYTWISRNKILPSRNTMKSGRLHHTEVFKNIRECNFDGFNPRLYNCLTWDYVFKKHYDLWGSYVGGPSPDIAFQFRQAFSQQDCIVFDIAVAASNSRHQLYTRGYGSGRISRTSSDQNHFAVFSDIVLGLPDCVHSQVMTQINDFIPNPKDHRLFYSLPHVYQKLIQELSYPKTIDYYTQLREGLARHILQSISEFTVSSSEVTLLRLRDIYNVLKRVRWTPLEHQVYPLIEDSGSLVEYSLEQLAKVEHNV
jgi:hypothetical protein